MKPPLLPLLLAAFAVHAGELKLWDGNMPGEPAGQPESFDAGKEPSNIHITNVGEPTLTPYLLERRDRPVPLVIVCPGGGYRILSFNKEGTEVAQWLNRIGVSALVLKYRVPDNREGALLDARRAVRLAREKAEEWNIDPHRVGMLGFSAGGHLAAACSHSPDRPDFAVLVYPAYLSKGDGIDLVDEIRPDAQTPPAFIIQAQDDTRFYRSSLAYAAALDRAGVPVELHLFAKGGHGFGLRETGHPASGWPALCEQWMVDRGILPR